MTPINPLVHSNSLLGSQYTPPKGLEDWYQECCDEKIKQDMDNFKLQHEFANVTR